MADERRQTRYTSNEYAALLGAIDGDGNFDQAAFEAQRDHRRHRRRRPDPRPKRLPGLRRPNGKTKVKPLVERTKRA